MTESTRSPEWDKVPSAVRPDRLRVSFGGSPCALQVKLSPQEVEFFAAYDRILSSYAKEYPLLDLTALPQVRTTRLSSQTLSMHLTEARQWSSTKPVTVMVS